MIIDDNDNKKKNLLVKILKPIAIPWWGVIMAHGVDFIMAIKISFVS